MVVRSFTRYLFFHLPFLRWNGWQACSCYWQWLSIRFIIWPWVRLFCPWYGNDDFQLFGWHLGDRLLEHLRFSDDCLVYGVSLWDVGGILSRQTCFGCLQWSHWWIDYLYFVDICNCNYWTRQIVNSFYCARIWNDRQLPLHDGCYFKYKYLYRHQVSNKYVWNWSK